MFTGIIEAIGKVEHLEKNAENITFTLFSPFSRDLKIDQSLAHNGCCLTVEEINADLYKVTAIAETLRKTNLNDWKLGSIINLERCLKFDGRLDGHIVQGHIDGVGKVVAIEERSGSFFITFRYSESINFITVPQGSITINGISLTVADCHDFQFSVAIIPYTWEYTNMKFLQIDDLVNLEFDIIGKYISKLMNR